MSPPRRLALPTLSPPTLFQARMPGGAPAQTRIRRLGCAPLPVSLAQDAAKALAP